MAWQAQQFNSKNSIAIEQSNVNWRREMNKIDTASLNAVMQANAMSKFQLSNQAMTYMWQEMRDSALWVEQAKEAGLNREHQIATTVLANEGNAAKASEEGWGELLGTALTIWSKSKS